MNTKKTKLGLLVSNYEGIINGKQVKLFIITNKNGLEASIITLGAKLVSMVVPDKEGKPTDVVLGHNSLDDYFTSEEPYFGAICGRVANRIAKGKFSLNGHEYHLAINNPPNSLHGGIKGFNAVVWEGTQINEQTLQLTYQSKDMEEGFPGNMNIKVTYHLSDDNSLDINYEADTDKATILNITNHSYFNLSGAGEESIYDHVVKAFASNYLPIDDTSIPTGEIANVEGTPFDFTTPHTLGERIDQKHEQLIIGKGYDHSLVIDSDRSDQLAIECYAPKTGIQMQITTTEPGVQIYTSNWLSGNIKGKYGKYYPARCAVCFETQHFPDSINHPNFPSTVLTPDEKFKSKTSFLFSVK